MSSGTCQYCGCSEIDVDPARGDAVCTKCGSVLEDSIIVSEVQFEESGHGGSRAIGQLVSSEGQSSGGVNLGYHHGLGKDSREFTLRKARIKITRLANQLKLNQHCVDTAYNFYKLALRNRMTQGRKHPNVIAACLYMVCRTEGTPHMLLDLSDLLQVNVYELGKTYLRLSTALCINIPAIDPCLYIVRFAHRLEFGDKTHEVSMTALRLVQRMKRDWMHTGRRPSGLCGAALLVAARLHDFNRTIKDIIKVVKVCQGTIRKRLMEFGGTPSSRLTLDEFMSIDLEEEQDPPSFIAGRQKHKVASQLEKTDQVNKATKEIVKLQKQIEKSLVEKSKKINSHYERLAQEGHSEGSVPDAVENIVTNEFIAEDTVDTINQILQNPNGLETVESVHEVELVNSLCNVSFPSLRQSPESKARGPGPTTQSLGLTESIEDCMRIPETDEATEEGGELDISGIDDGEIDSYIMTKEEVKQKTELWMKVNADYLEEQRIKEERKVAELEKAKPEQKKRKRQTRKRSAIQASTAGEAIDKMLQEKKLSSKINYDVLKNLNSSAPLLPSVGFVLEEVKAKPSFSLEGVPSKKSRTRMFSGGAPPSAITGVMKSIIAGSKKESAVEDEEEDTQKINVKDSVEVKIEEQTKEPTSAPVEEIEEDIVEEEDEEDEMQLSAAQLLGQHRGDEEVDDYYMDEEYMD